MLRLHKNLKQNSAHSGIILLEFIIYIALVLLVIGFTSIQIHYFDKSMILNELQTLHLSIFTLQQRSQSEQSEKEIVFDENRHFYTIDGVTHQLPNTVRFGWLDGVKGPPSDAKSTIKKAVTFPHNKIVLHPDGTIQAGTVYLVDKNKRFLFALTCPVGQISYVRNYVYEKGWQKM